MVWFVSKLFVCRQNGMFFCTETGDLLKKEDKEKMSIYVTEGGVIMTVSQVVS